MATKTLMRDISVAGDIQSSGDLVTDRFVVAAVTVPNATGGATTAALTMQVNRLDGTPVTSAREVLIVGSSSRFAVGASATLSYGSATVGTIVGSGSGRALVRTDATGAFACTATNSADETLYFFAVSADSVSNAAYGCFVRPGVASTAVWSA